VAAAAKSEICKVPEYFVKLFAVALSRSALLILGEPTMQGVKIIHLKVREFSE
jgi:hypothetical protein